MTALYIIGGILLFIVLLLILPVGIRIKYEDQLCLYVCIGPFKKKLIPAKPKKIKIGYYKQSAIDKRRKKAEKKAMKKQKKDSKKKPSGGAKKQKRDSVLVSRLKSIDTAPDMISELFDMMQVITNAFAKRLKITVVHIDAIIGSGNAATTAILYGAACSSAGCITSFLDQHADLVKKNANSINVAADFLAERTTASVDVKMTVRFGGIFTFIYEIRKVIFKILELLQEDDNNG